MNMGKKFLALSLIFAIGGAKAAITRAELEVIGSVLREFNVLSEIIPYPEAKQYVFAPISAIGDFMWNLDILEPELSSSIKGIKNFRTLSACAKLPGKYLTMSDAELIKEIKDPRKLEQYKSARKACPQVACTGDRLACTIEGIKNLSAFLTAVQKTLFGYYKTDGKAYLVCPEGKKCDKILGVSELVLKVGQQDQIYRNVLNPKVNEPLARVINILDQLEKILTLLKGGKTAEGAPTAPAKPAVPATQEPKQTVPAAPPIPESPVVKPAIKEVTKEAESTSTIPDAPALEPAASGIPEAPPLEEPSKPVKPAGQKITPVKPQETIASGRDLSKVGLESLTDKELASEITRLSKSNDFRDQIRLRGLKTEQNNRAGVTKPTSQTPAQKPAQQGESLITPKLQQDVAEKMREMRKAMAPEEPWE